tara:strand:- start:149 stop:742 length:594 start_codon:yes stop_codon:yes gene_type:complete
MASQVQIAKLALQHIGDRYDIADLDEETVEAEQVNLIFDDTRDELLRRQPWRFAKKYTDPSTLAVTVPGGWDYAYQYPTDAVKVRGITNILGFDADPIDFEVALLADNTKVILTNQDEAEVFYTARVTDTTRFDPEFTMGLSFLLASRVAMALTGSLDIKSALDQEVLRIISHAADTDSSEGRNRAAPEASWIDARV